MGKKSSLGRGLDAILSDVEYVYEKELKSGKTDMVVEIEIDKIKPNPYQPRKSFDEEALKELSESIDRHGLIQPIIVIRDEDGENYTLIAGERRFRATKLLRKDTIKAVIADIKSQNLRELALIENIQRENLNPIELANSYKELIEEYSITQDELSNIIKKSRVQITNTLRLLNLLPSTQKAVVDGKISQGHAKVLIGLSNSEEELVVNTIIGQKLSVRQTEDLVRKLKTNQNENAKKEIKVNEEFLNKMQSLKFKLEKFGKVALKDKKISIEFNEISQISEFIDRIS